MNCWSQVVFFERDISQVKAGEKKELLYSTVTGLKSDLSGTQQTPEILDQAASDPAAAPTTGSSASEDSDGSDSQDEAGNKKFVSSARPRDESPNSKKVPWLACFLAFVWLRLILDWRTNRVHFSSAPFFNRKGRRRWRPKRARSARSKWRSTSRSAKKSWPSVRSERIGCRCYNVYELWQLGWSQTTRDKMKTSCVKN